MLNGFFLSLRGWWQCVLLLAVFSTRQASAEDWPHWRGPHRNGHVNESSAWQGGTWLPPAARWKKNVGEGSTSPLVFQGRVYTLGWQDDRDTVYAVQAESGKVLWRQSYASPRYGRRSTGDKGLYGGPTSTPELDTQTGLLYTLGVDGDLRCWDVRKDGQLRWQRNLYDDFDPPRRPKVGRRGLRDYGYTTSPLVYGDWLIVEVGGTAGNLIGFDKLTGEQRWRSAAEDPAGHTGGPVPLTVAEIPCVAIHNFNGLLVVRLDSGHRGETLARYPWKTEFANNIATVAVHEDNVVLTSAYNHYKIARLRIKPGKVEPVWTQDFASKVCTPVIHQGHIYWAWQTVTCLDYETGELKWQGGTVGDPGSCIVTADQRLIIWGGRRGNLQLVETAKRSPDQYRLLAERRRVFRTDAWPHVVLAAGQLYLKDRAGNVKCFELR